MAALFITAARCRDEEEDIRNIPGARSVFPNPNLSSANIASSLNSLINTAGAELTQQRTGLQFPQASLGSFNGQNGGGLLSPQQQFGIPQPGAFGPTPFGSGAAPPQQQGSGILGVLNNLGRQLTGAGKYQF